MSICLIRAYIAPESSVGCAGQYERFRKGTVHTSQPESDQLCRAVDHKLRNEVGASRIGEISGRPRDELLALALRLNTPEDLGMHRLRDSDIEVPMKLLACRIVVRVQGLTFGILKILVLLYQNLHQLK